MSVESEKPRTAKMAVGPEKTRKVSKTTSSKEKTSSGEKRVKTSSSKEKTASGEKRVKKSSASKDDDSAKTHKLALKGSSKIVSEFFEYSIHSILFQRGVYPAEDFSPVKKYGLTMMVSADDQVQAYIKKIMGQLRKWMQGAKINKLVIVITSRETGDHVERWQFDIDIFGKNKPTKPTPAPAPAPADPDADSENDENTNTTSSNDNSQNNTPPPRAASPPKEKTEAEIQSEIQSLFRQITASVTFLPMLDGNCTFNVLVYADADSDVPVEWGDSDAKEIEGGEKVQLRSFSTSQHKVDTVVSYRMAG